MDPEQFISTYEAALRSQNWKNVDPLVSQEVSVTFSNGKVHKGKEAVKEAFENNFTLIQSEEFIIKNIFWVKRTQEFAVYLFDYNWSGIINENLVSGSGAGTTVLMKRGKRWLLLTEHLSK